MDCITMIDCKVKDRGTGSINKYGAPDRIQPTSLEGWSLRRLLTASLALEALKTDKDSRLISPASSYLILFQDLVRQTTWVKTGPP